MTDIFDALRARRLWWTLAVQEVRGRYRRTILGPFWITIGLGTLVVMLGLIYPGLFGHSPRNYTPYLAAGFVAWFFISSLVTEGCFSILNAAHSIKQIKVPITVFCFQVVARNCIVLAHNFLVFVGVALFFLVPVGGVAFLALLAVAIYIITGLAAGVILGIVCARYRDVPPLVATVMQIMFFLTPIFWHADKLPDRAMFILYNPFYHFVEIFRAPLLGNAPSVTSWIVALGCMGLLLGMMLVVLARYRRRVVFWL